MSSPSNKQLGGAFTSPAAGFAQRGGSGGGQQGESPPGDAVAHLGIRRPPPTHVYFNEVFEVEFGLEIARGSSRSPPTNVTILASLIPAEAAQESLSIRTHAATPAKLVLLEEPRISPSRRTGKLKCKILPQQSGTAATSDNNNNNHAYVIEIRTKQSPPPTSTPVLITPVSTRIIHVVDYKLVASPVDWDPIWYKDEGGRDKCMEVTVGLYDIGNQLVLPNRKQVTLTFNLCYQSKSGNHQEHPRVNNQDILKTLGSTSKCNQFDEQGRARVRFRVEDVSKNHQGQDFILMIAASDSSVAPAYTPPVSVRSKRNKRLRNLSSSGRSSGSVSDPQPTGGAGATRNISAHSGQQPAMLGAAGGEPPPSTMPPKLTAGPPSLNIEGTDQESNLREAIQGVTQWADEVVNGLYPLQWHVLGYAQHPDGSPDYSRPYHSMPNPNPLINRVLSMYSDSARGQLRLIENAIMRTTSTSTTSRASPGGGGSPFTPHPGSAGGMPPLQQQQGATQHSEPYGMMMPGHPPQIHGASRSGPPMQVQQQPPFLQQQQQGMQVGQQPRPPPPSSIPIGGGDIGMQPPPPPIPGQQQHLHPQHQQPPNLPPMDSYRGDASYPPPYHPNYFPRPPRGTPSVATPGQSQQPQQRYDEATDPLPVTGVLVGPAASQGPAPTAASATAAAATPTAAAAAAAAASPSSRSRQRRPPSPTVATARRLPEDEEGEEDSREHEVEFILAKQYKSLRTGERLGFPAYSAHKEILGFYRESASSKGHGGHSFVSLSRHVSDYEEIERMASTALNEAIESKNGAVHARRDWGSISNMIDHALVYDWSKDISGASSSGNNRSSSPDM